MTDTRSAPEAATIDATALGRWMDAEKLPGDGVPLLTRLSGGSQNELFVVERDGSVTQLVAFDRVAWHAGQSQWRGRSGCNAFLWASISSIS